MAKPRIIIADIDESYIAPLRNKFVDEFFEKVDLEIITDRAYLETLFSTPQKVDIVIVSEDFYGLFMQRHNIAHTFIMTEHYEEEQTTDLTINYIFKYTSIKEIFNEIVGKSADVFRIEIEQKETQVLLVYSVRGGTGKTTVAMGLSTVLSKNYKRVLYINASHLQSFQRVLENMSPIAMADVYAKLAHANDDIYAEIKHVIRKEEFSYLPPFKAALMSLGLKYSIYEKIIVSAKKSGDYDYIVVDADSTFDEDKARLLNIADRVIIVTDQSESSVFATNLLVGNINGASSDKYVFVCNNFQREKDNALISPSMLLKFATNEYIEHFEHYDRMKCQDFAKDSELQKIAIFVM